MSRPWIVLKFGGTSVATAAGWRRIAERIRAVRRRHRAWVVVSALAGVSDGLEACIERAIDGDATESLAAVVEAHRALARELGVADDAFAPVAALLDRLGQLLEGVALTGEAPPRLRARVLATGELASSRLGEAALAALGEPVRWVDARDLLESDRLTDRAEHDEYLNARVTAAPRPEDAEALADGAAAVLTQGFIARTHDRATCLLGRGGSDTSASLFGVLLGAAAVQIWTDVHGMFTADPRLVPGARLILRLGYREAQELAALGAKVLHPRCLPPVAAARIPLTIHSTHDPERDGTRIEKTGEAHPAVTAVTCRTGVTLVTLDTLAMWERPGFLARTFEPFRELGISIDLVATSQSSISMTLDRLPDGVEGEPFRRLVERLESLGRLRVTHPVAVVSIVGRQIRAALAELGQAMEVFQERPVHLISDSAEDLNLSFVVSEGDVGSLVVRLHERLFSTQGDTARLGPTWETLEGRPRGVASEGAWWRGERERLLALMADGAPRYAYHLPTVVERARAIRDTLRTIERPYYSMKANAHPALLAAIAGEGFGIECVSAAEIAHARATLGPDVPLLFTPNFCPAAEYVAAFEAGAEVVVDGPEPLRESADVFRGREIGLRIDPGRGLGHHEKVRTAGARAKFGHPLGHAGELREACDAAGVTVVGLHAHVGSGVLDPAAWSATGRALASLLRTFDAVRWIDAGGGLGVVERPGQSALDLARLEQGLARLTRSLDGVTLRVEPGRYLVSDAGVLLAPVTQVRRKAGVRFVGLATGMNSLIRPALYGAWHGIHNLTRLDDEPAGYWHVVGPICETSDVLGRDRLLPETLVGDVVLIENAGAYGAVMASRYNLREPAVEVVLEAS